MTSLPKAPRALGAASGLCLAVSAACSLPATAQPRLDTVVVTATREPQALDRVAADVVLIDRERILASPAGTLEDLLQREAGLLLSRNGGPGQAAGVFIRGSGAGSTVVLIDGVRVGSATLGLAALATIGLAQIERIEVLRGPGSSLYGADAVGGVVQIFTRRGQAAPRLTARLAVGGERSRSAELGASGRHGAVDLAASLTQDRSVGVSALRPGDGFGNHNPDRDGFQRSTGQLKLGLTPAEGHRIGLVAVDSRIASQYDGSQFLAPNFTQDPTPDFRDDSRSRVVSLDYRGRIAASWTTTLQLARNDDVLAAGAAVVNRYDTRRDQFSWQNAVALDAAQQLLVALDWMDERVEASGLAPGLKRHNRALVLGYTGRFGPSDLQVDLRHDDNSVHGGVSTGRLGGRLALGSGLTLRALAGTSFRGPTFNDLYFPGYGVITVQPERGRSVELGLNWAGEASELSLTAYRNRVRDLIAYQPDRRFCPPAAAYNFGCAANVSRARLQGLSLSGAHRWNGWQVQAGIELLDATDELTGSRLPRRAAHQETLAVSHTRGPWTLGGTLLNLGARPDGGVTLARVTTLDLNAAWRLAPAWQLEAKLLNATDRDLQPVRDYQGLGRQAWVGIRYDGGGR